MQCSNGMEWDVIVLYCKLIVSIVSPPTFWWFFPAVRREQDNPAKFRYSIAFTRTLCDHSSSISSSTIVLYADHLTWFLFYPFFFYSLNCKNIVRTFMGTSCVNGFVLSINYFKHFIEISCILAWLKLFKIC